MTEKIHFHYEECISLGKEYCTFIENAFDQTKINLFALQNLLLLLFLKSSKLPEAKESDSDFEDYIIEDSVVRDMVKDRLPFGLYWQIANPTNMKEPELIVGDLVDDLGDIYKDLKSSISLHELGTKEAHNKSYHQLKTSFDSHWSEHCMNAIKAIHDYLVNNT